MSQSEISSDRAPEQQVASGGQDSQYRMKFHGKGADLAILALRNVLLSLITLGVYSFWGKVNFRKFLWQNSEFHGQRFIYSGTGKELFIGSLKVAAIFLLGNGLVKGASHFSPKIAVVIGAVFVLIVLCVVPFAIYSSQRYLYSRTSWRGIRFAMHPDAAPFVKTFVFGYFLTVITLGLYGPVWRNRLYATRINRSCVGTLMLRYTGADKQAFLMFLKALPLIVITAGIYSFWYHANATKFRAHNTWIGGATLGAARGHLTLTGGDYLGLMLLNVVLLVGTFGLAIPWIIAHNMAFYLTRFSFIGAVDFDQIKQIESKGNAMGDSLASSLDVGLGV